MKRNCCLVCGHKNMIEIIDLGNHAYADTFVEATRLHDRLPVYKLSCELCPDCGQIQTGCSTIPAERYGMHQYSYTSSNSPTARDHWQEYSKIIAEKTKLSPESMVVEVGSNDGYLLEQFKNLGHHVVGIDASSYVAEIAIKNGISTMVSIFDNRSAPEIKNSISEEIDLVVANNVFNHSESPLSFAQGARLLLRDGGHFVYELPYWLCSIESKKVDQVYHEHVSYFTVKSSAEIMARSGFKIIDVEVVDYHGGSLRIIARKNNDNLPHAPIVYKMIEKEGLLFKKETYDGIMKELEDRKYKFLSHIAKLKSSGESVIAIGAAAKGNTFLNFVNLDGTLIDYVTDASKHKQGKYTPLTNIPIASDNILSSYGRVYAIILSWNIADKIKPKLKEINPRIQFLDFYE